jgi:tRNA G10  N-methylase Trm11
MAVGEMSQSEFTTFLQNALQLAHDHASDGSMHFICMDFRHMVEMLAAGGSVYGEVKNLCVWVKNVGGMGSLYRSRHELVFVFKKGTSPHINNVELGRHGRYRTNVWEHRSIVSSRHATDEGDLLALHPTVKPVRLVADAILDCSKRGNIVLDAFLGSGSTLIAAQRTGRICYGLELDPLYVDTAIRRWQADTGGDAVHAVTGKTFTQHHAAMLAGLQESSLVEVAHA